MAKVMLCFDWCKYFDQKNKKKIKNIFFEVKKERFFALLRMTAHGVRGGAERYTTQCRICNGVVQNLHTNNKYIIKKTLYNKL